MLKNEDKQNNAVKKSLDIPIVKSIGLPTLIIAAFFLLVMITAAVLKQSLPILISDILRRFGMNGVLVLAMVPAIKSGTGPNFALPLGIICGLLAWTIGIEMGFLGIKLLLITSLLATIFATATGYFYGKLLNAVKGAEMTIATYTGFSVVALMSLVWLMAPFQSKQMGWMMGKGLRETIKLDGVNAGEILNNFLAFEIIGIKIPTGLLLTFFTFCFLVWLFFRTKTGAAIIAGGSNPAFAAASGIDIDKNRVIANILSTVLGAYGIIIYSQSYGFFQLYSGPLMMAFPAVAGVLIGGATASKANISHVIIGTFLLQGLLTASMPVANQLFAGTDLSEIMRVILQNGIILYALTQVKGGGK
jgi:simple sugar transport system permease protein